MKYKRPMNAITDMNLNSVGGTVKTVTFHNPENGFFVARINSMQNTEITVVGRAPSIFPGEVIQAKGKWKASTHGPQFQADSLELTTPKEAGGIEKYLTHSVKGIGPSFAKKLVAALGTSLFDVIQNEPEKLSQIPGIGPKRAEAVVAAILEGEALRKIMVFLYQHGMSAAKAKRVYESLGPKAVDKLNANPYLMVTVWGVGFPSADEFAKSLGISHNSEHRLRAGVLFCLTQAKSEGTCGLPEQTLVEKAQELLAVEEMGILSAIESEIMAGTIVAHQVLGATCLFHAAVYESEKRLAREILRIRDARPRFTVENVDQLIEIQEKSAGFKLERIQREAVKLALANNFCVVTGGPGCGKTTLTKVILQVYDQLGKSVVLAAPTGKAAKRASEATGFEASTAHRLLEVASNGKFKFNKDNKLTADVLVLDEMSMMDIFMSESVLQAVMAGSRVIVVGDVDQLDSVGCGKVLYDLIASGEIPTVKLTEVFRQAATSKIIVNAHRVNKGETPPLGWRDGDDFGFLTTTSAQDNRDIEKEDLSAQIIKTVRSMWERDFDPIRDVQVLAPMRAGALGTKMLNLALQKALNPNPVAKLERFGQFWCVGDKVIHMRNNYTKLVFNGEVGFIKRIDQESKSFTVEYDGREVDYESNEMDELQLAYALTIHKSQGSEFPVVVMACDVSHFMMLKRKIIYTGMTRAKKLMLIVGTKKALAMAVNNSQVDERFSLLAHWLRTYSHEKQIEIQT